MKNKIRDLMLTVFNPTLARAQKTSHTVEQNCSGCRFLYEAGTTIHRVRGTIGVPITDWRCKRERPGTVVKRPRDGSTLISTGSARLPCSHWNSRNECKEKSPADMTCSECAFYRQNHQLEMDENEDHRCHFPSTKKRATSHPITGEATTPSVTCASRNDIGQCEDGQLKMHLRPISDEDSNVRELTYVVVAVAVAAGLISFLLPRFTN